MGGLEQIREEDAPWTYGDEAFENWAAYHRQRRIPLVAMERVPQYLSVLAANPSEQENETTNIN